MNEIENQLFQIEGKVSQFEKLNKEISSSNVGWHIQHMLLTINSIIESLSHSNPKDYKWTFNFIKIVIMTMNKIPRGKGKAPKKVQPNGDYTIESLTKHLLETRINTEQLKSMKNNKFFEHPSFGKLKLKKAINFMGIHTKHHLDIINDIIK